MVMNILLVHICPLGPDGLAGGLVQEGAIPDAGGADRDGHGCYSFSQYLFLCVFYCVFPHTILALLTLPTKFTESAESERCRGHARVGISFLYKQLHFRLPG